MAPEFLFFGLVVVGLAAATVLQQVGDSLAEPTELDVDGVCCTRVDGELVPAAPAALARGRGKAPDVYALARVIQSEAGSLAWIGQVGVAWTVKNHCRDVGRSVLAVVTRATLSHGAEDGAGDGFFGRQGSSSGGYRYVASSKDPTDDDLATAEAVLAGDVDDPTEGALNFDSPHSYGAQEGTDAAGADTFAANREAEGKVKVLLPGIAESRIRFWRPA